jgi:hypothetical protein
MTDATEDTFLRYLTEANALVLAAYPSAQFYEADNFNASAPGSQWRFVFNDPSTTPNSTIIIERLEQSFGKPRHIPDTWVGDRVIQLPISLGLAEARTLCEGAGCRGKVDEIVLRYPLYPGVSEPSYILIMPAESQRGWVGVNTRQVRCERIEPSS